MVFLPNPINPNPEENDELERVQQKGVLRFLRPAALETDKVVRNKGRRRHVGRREEPREIERRVVMLDPGWDPASGKGRWVKN